MAHARNVLFIMCDQLRADHLSAYGHPTLHTPNIDSLARRGVTFDNAYVSSPVCGPSRMSYYTGRSMASHGAIWNRCPLSIRELTLGDYLSRAGRTAVLAGKTHVMPDTEALARYGIEVESERGALLRAGGFTSIDRYDGHHEPGPESHYAQWLRERGYDSPQPWHDYVIATVDPQGGVHDGWRMRSVHWPARVAREHSETVYMTDRAIDFVRARGDEPWVLHFSLVKPHWPYVAPAPYHDMYRAEDCLPVRKRESELVDQHPVIAAFRRHEWCENWARDEVARRVRPVYMGLVKQVDDELGRLFAELEALGRFDDTLIVFTADHGEFSGDHWLGEKELFFEQAARVPFIVVDPSPLALATRGTRDARFVECADVVPTILDALGIEGDSHRIEGRSLLPLVRGAAADWRDMAVSEIDYSFYEARRVLGRAPGQCRGWMIRCGPWKYVHWQGYAPQIYHLGVDPDEYVDRGADPSLEPLRREMRDRLLEWLGSRKYRSTMGDAEIERRTNAAKSAGVYIGVW
jgi:arylsulfatase A-like enzyme